MILKRQIPPDQVGKAAEALRKEFYLGGRKGRGAGLSPGNGLSASFRARVRSSGGRRAE